MTNLPTTPAACYAERERVLEPVNEMNAALAEVSRLWDIYKAEYDAIVAAADANDYENYPPPLPEKSPELKAADARLARARESLPAPTPFLEAHADLLAAYAQALERERWVSVEERLPESGEAVMFFDAEHGRCVGEFWLKDEYPQWYANWAESVEFLHVTHWQPLPAPPSRGPQ